MHINIFLLTAISIAANAFALPTSNTTSEHLEERGLFGYAGSYVAEDCSGPWIIGPYSRPSVHGQDCHVLTTYSDNIGVNFGESIQHFAEMTFFTDHTCTTKADLGIVQPGGAKDSGMACVHPGPRPCPDRNGDLCFEQLQYGVKWGPRVQ